MKVVWRSNTTKSGAPSVMMVSTMLMPVLFVASLVTGKYNIAETLIQNDVYVTYIPMSMGQEL